MVVTLSGAPVPADTLGVLTSAAEDHPSAFADALRGQPQLLRDNVRGSRDGVLARGEKVIDLDRIVSTIDKSEVTQSTVMEKKSSIVWTIAGAGTRPRPSPAVTG